MDGLLRLVAAVEKTANNAREKHSKQTLNIIFCVLEDGRAPLEKEVDDLRHQAQREADLAKARNGKPSSVRCSCSMDRRASTEKQDSDLRLQMEKAKEEREKNGMQISPLNITIFDEYACKEKKVTDLCLQAEENARDARDTHGKRTSIGCYFSL